MCRAFTVAAILFAFQLSAVKAAELLFPQERQAFYSHEPIELAVASLPTGSKAVVELVPTRSGVTPLSFEVLGKTGTTTDEQT